MERGGSFRGQCPRDPLCVGNQEKWTDFLLGALRKEGESKRKVLLKKGSLKMAICGKLLQ